MASYLKVILRLAAKAGPVALIVARELTPQIQRILKENPNAFAAITGRFGKAVGSKKEGKFSQRFGEPQPHPERTSHPIFMPRPTPVVLHAKPSHGATN